MRGVCGVVWGGTVAAIVVPVALDQVLGAVQARGRLSLGTPSKALPYCFKVLLGCAYYTAAWVANPVDTGCLLLSCSGNPVVTWRILQG